MSGVSDNDDKLPKKKAKFVTPRAKPSETELECLEKGCYVGFFCCFVLLNFCIPHYIPIAVQDTIMHGFRISSQIKSSHKFCIGQLFSIMQA